MTSAKSHLKIQKKNYKCGAKKYLKEPFLTETEESKKMTLISSWSIPTPFPDEI